jgi:hypothetical protein
MSGIRIHSAAVTISLALGFAAGVLFEHGKRADLIHAAEFKHLMANGEWKSAEEIRRAYHVNCNEGKE